MLREGKELTEDSRATEFNKPGTPKRLYMSPSPILFPVFYNISTLVSTILRTTYLCLALVNIKCLPCAKSNAMLGVVESVKINKNLAFKETYIHIYICIYVCVCVYIYIPCL
jgi:hypothetical protein